MYRITETDEIPAIFHDNIVVIITYIRVGHMKQRITMHPDTVPTVIGDC